MSRRADETSRDEIAIIQLQIETVKNKDLPSWRRFLDKLSTIVASNIPFISVRWTEAKISSIETDNQVILLKARAEYEQIQAAIREKEAGIGAASKKVDVKVRTGKATGRQEEAEARIAEAAAREIEARSMGVEAAAERLRRAIEKIQMAGGVVEFDLPRPDDEDGEE